MACSIDCGFPYIRPCDLLCRAACCCQQKGILRAFLFCPTARRGQAAAELPANTNQAKKFATAREETRLFGEGSTTRQRQSTVRYGTPAAVPSRRSIGGGIRTDPPRIPCPHVELLVDPLDRATRTSVLILVHGSGTARLDPTTTCCRRRRLRLPMRHHHAPRCRGHHDNVRRTHTHPVRCRHRGPKEEEEDDDDIGNSHRCRSHPLQYSPGVVLR